MRSRRRSGSHTPEFFARALPSKKIKQFRAGETIISQGEDCTDVHYIEKGVVKLTLVSDRGKGAVLGILGGGDFLEKLASPESRCIRRPRSRWYPVW